MPGIGGTTWSGLSRKPAKRVCFINKKSYREAKTGRKHQIPIGRRVAHQWFSPTRLPKSCTAGRHNLKRN